MEGRVFEQTNEINSEVRPIMFGRHPPYKYAFNSLLLQRSTGGVTRTVMRRNPSSPAPPPVPTLSSFSGSIPGISVQWRRKTPTLFGDWRHAPNCNTPTHSTHFHLFYHTALVYRLASRCYLIHVFLAANSACHPSTLLMTLSPHFPVYPYNIHYHRPAT